MRGRKPKPSAVKDLLGNPGRRLNPAEPKPKVCIPSCPKVLAPEAQKYWDLAAAQLEQLGILTAVDGVALAVLCDLWAGYLEAQDKVEKLGPIAVSKNGHGYPSPYLTAAMQYRKQIREYLVEFGLTPSSRSRVAKSGGDAGGPRQTGLDFFLQGDN
jgi:P27 family predicted phage terminase small subunit